MFAKQRPFKMLKRPNLELMSLKLILKFNALILVRGNHPSIIILEANDIIFAQIFTILDFDQD
jgi:hypothetical protein